MFLIRQSKPADVGTFLKLARMVYFINLPPDDRIIASKIDHSQRCFKRLGNAAGPQKTALNGRAGSTDAKSPTRKRRDSGHSGFSASEEDSDLFVFTIEDPESGGVIGTSQVRAHQGGPGNPNWSMRVSERKFHSDSLGFGTTHTVARLWGDESGPSEVGGLILQPSHRGHRLRPGRLLSYVRFHFIGLHPKVFAERVLAEMMAPVSPEGDNIFWDHIGRKFIPVKYSEADRFCQHNRKFISDLLPKDDIFLTLLPLEVLNTVGVVSNETIPARRMLEQLGFAYRGFIDPFDGGPHLDARTDDIALVRDTRNVTLGPPIAPDKCPGSGIASILSPEGDFLAVETPCVESEGVVRLTERALELLRAEPGVRAGFTPLGPLPGANLAEPRVTAKRPRKKARA